MGDIKIKLTIIYDNELYRKNVDLQSNWGFACLIESKYDIVLFDTGRNGEILLGNMNKLNINPRDIKKIVISHEHEDHKGGLKSLVPYLKNIKLYHLSHETPSEKMISIIPKARMPSA